MSKTADNRPLAFSYLRFSTPEQARGASKKRQMEKAEEYARLNNLRLDETIRDEGVSAFKGKNKAPSGALGAFLARVEAGDIRPGSYLLIESFDRLSREHVVDALELFLSLTRKGITIVTLMDDRVYNRESIKNDTTQLLVSIIIMSRAYEESATKSKRVGDAWNRKKTRARTEGQAMTARCPAWLRLVGGPRHGRYEIIPERAALVEKIFEDVIAGDGRRTIATRLNRAGVPNWGVGRTRGLHWHDSYIQKILENHSVYGRYVKADIAIEGYFPAVVTEDVFYRAAAAAAKRGSKRGNAGKWFHNVLSGLVRCHACSSTMIYSDKGSRSRPKLVCSKAVASAGCAARERYSYEWVLHRTIATYQYFADATAFAVDKAEGGREAALAALEAKMAQLKSAEANLIAAIEKGFGGEAIIDRQRGLHAEARTVASQIRAERIELAKDVDMVGEVAERFASIMERIHTDDPVVRYQERSRLNGRLAHYIEKIVITPDKAVTVTLKPQFEGIDGHAREHLDAYDDPAAIEYENFE